MTPHDGWTLDALLEAYRQHQRRTRGLRDQTLHGYERLARLLVRVALGDDPIDPTRLNPGDVTAFVASMRGSYSPRSMKTVRTALRSFFRFLRVQGLCDERLEAAVPAVAHWRLSTLPRCLSDQQLERVLASLDGTSPFGRRDRAIVLCLSSLGLRPGEVANLRLEDIDWRDGTVELRTRKTRRGAVLPLPREVGRAIVAYLRNKRAPDNHRTPRIRAAHWASLRRADFEQRRLRRCGPGMSTRGHRATTRWRLRLPSHRGKPNGPARGQPQGNRRLFGAPQPRHHDDLRQDRLADAA